MKTCIRYFVPALALVAVLPAARSADEEKPASKDKKAPLRVLASPERGERRVFVQHGDKLEKENVTFLGVEASPAPAALAAQLGLTRGTGLVVGHISPKSPAEGVLQQHDILLKLDDQILIEPHQLSVLIRSHKEGDEVTLTYLRAGKQATAKVKLATREMPKLSLFERAIPQAFSSSSSSSSSNSDSNSNSSSNANANRFEMRVARPDGLEGEEWDRVLSLLQRARPAPDSTRGGFVPPGARIRIDHGDGPGFRAMSINTANSSLAFTDDEGSLDLTMKDGVKQLVAKNAKGEPLFSGPVTTPEERKAMPAHVRERLEKLEGMHDVTFRTDGDFKGGELRVMPFPPKEISLPLPAPAAIPRRGPRFF
jgi:serine protease Do